uniref:Nitroreductase family protein n=1 Tax=Desulfatirhabdium butyrativorans TaxID=340467 RepID=A0A7C4W7R1_9BACT
MDFQDVVTQRRAINFFDPDRGVDTDLIRRMIEMASKVPSSFNLQPWNVILVTDPKEKQILRKLAWDQPKVSEAPVVMIVLADRDGWKAGHPTAERNFQEMVHAGSMKPEQKDWFHSACTSLYGQTPEKQQAFANKNTGFFAMTLMFAAKHLGLDTHPMDGFDIEGVRKAFAIPEHFWIPLLLAVGYPKPDFNPLPPKWRKSYEEIVVRFAAPSLP